MKVKLSPEQQFTALSLGTTQIIPDDQLLKKLKTGKPLNIKLGMDPTAPDLHLGHAVVLSKMRQFQDFGHNVIFLIGDFTARIGDPTGKSKTRPPLSDEVIAKNTATYFEQVSKILDPKRVTIRFNSEWLNNLSSKDIISLCAKVTLSRLTERDDFAQRIKAHEPIGMHELLYPLFQGYDSVALKADVELGGTDQTFNLLMGRFLQEQYGQEPQVIITTPLLEGLDGVQKMSKSLGNYVGLAETAEQAYGKLMSISDKLMWRYMEVLLHASPGDVAVLQERVAAGTSHPMELKKEMAYNVIARFWSDSDAKTAQAQFEALFQRKDYSQANAVALPAGTANPIWIVELLKLLQAVPSSSEARRLIEAGAVKVDDVAITDPKANIAWQVDTQIKVGKHRIYKLI
jgi:tyrosyl-tRNA synthetase